MAFNRLRPFNRKKPFKKASINRKALIKTIINFGSPYSEISRQFDFI